MVLLTGLSVKKVETPSAVPAVSEKQVRCQVDEMIMGGHPAADVPVSICSGNGVGDEKEITYLGNKLSAQYNKGDEYESQSRLTMVLNDTSNIVYNVSKTSLYVLQKGKIRFQCWFE